MIFNKNSHELAKIESDNAMIAIEKKNIDKLNEYFMQNVYPPIKHNIN